MERESFVFYRSYAAALKKLPKREQLRALLALIDFALDGTEPDLEGSAEGMFILIKPQIEANNRKYANGKKGGAPEGNQNATKNNQKQPRNNQKQPNVNVNVNVNDNVNVNENENVNALSNESERTPSRDGDSRARSGDGKHRYGEYRHVLLTDQEYEKLVHDYGSADTQEAISYLDEYVEMKGAKYKSHYLAMRKWVFKAVWEKRNDSYNNEHSPTAPAGYGADMEYDYTGAADGGAENLGGIPPASAEYYRSLRNAGDSGGKGSP